MVKSGILRWTGHVAKMEEGTRAFKLLTVKSLGGHRRTILEFILNKYMSIREIRLIRLRIEITGEPL